jgi:hypothetical protein
MKTWIKTGVLSGLLAGLLFFSGCENKDPEPENIPELITKLTLRFAPAGGGAVVTVTATDPDGEGVKDLQVDGPITLVKGTQYNLTLELINGLYAPGEEGYDLTEEIEEEADEHQFFFGFSEGVFSSPAGKGNIKESASDIPGPINYLDQDKNGRPLGLITSWTTANASASGKTFRIMLKHQPDIKSTSSTSLDGETDLDISFILNVN